MAEIQNKKRRDWLTSLIGKDKTQEVIDDLAQAAATLDKTGVERKSKKTKATKQELVETIVEQVTSAVTEAVSEAVEEVVPEALDEGVSSTVEEETATAAEDDDEPMPPPDDEEDKQDGPAIAQRVAQAVLGSLQNSGIAISEEALSSALEAAASALAEVEQAAPDMGMMQRDGKALQGRIAAILNGYDELVQDQGAIAKVQGRQQAAIKSLAEVVQELVREQAEVKKLLTARPRQASRDDSTELKASTETEKQVLDKLLAKAQTSIETQYEDFLGIKVRKDNHRETA